MIILISSEGEKLMEETVARVHLHEAIALGYRNQARVATIHDRGQRGTRLRILLFNPKMCGSECCWRF